MTADSPTRWPRGFQRLMWSRCQGAFPDHAPRWLVIFPVPSSGSPIDSGKTSFASQVPPLLATRSRPRAIPEMPARSRNR